MLDEGVLIEVPQSMKPFILFFCCITYNHLTKHIFLRIFRAVQTSNNDRTIVSSSRYWHRGMSEKALQNMTGSHKKIRQRVARVDNQAALENAPSPCVKILPYGRQVIDDEDIAAVIEVLRSDWLTTGPMVREFEMQFAQTVGAKYAVACSSGTAALHLAAMALHLGPGDQVIVPTMTFLATANAARYVGADVVFCDVDPATGLMTAETFDLALKSAPRAKAVIPVHLAGQCADMVTIQALAHQHGLAVIEDACHALGGFQDCKRISSPVGSCTMSDMSVFSLHPVKIITTGEGGAITTNNERLFERLCNLRVHGITKIPSDLTSKSLAFDAAGEPNPWYYEMRELGYNYRISDINCALGITQLAKLAGFVERRREIVALYDDFLKPLAPLVMPLGRTTTSAPAWHLYIVRIDFKAVKISRAEVMRAMSETGVGTQVHYIPVHHQPYYKALYGYKHFPGAERYYDHCLSIPLYPTMTDEDVMVVVQALQTVLGEK